MSNAFDKASLVMLPHAYEDGKLYSLKPTDRSGDFTFSRGTDTATRVGEDGYIKKETQNLLLQSNSFGTTWGNTSGTNYTLTGGQTGYDGTNNAWLLDKQNPANSYVAQSVSVTGIYSASIYAKKGTADAIMIYCIGGYARFSLNDGSIIGSGSSPIQTKTEDIGNGWYRCIVTGRGTTTYSLQVWSTTSGYTTGSVYIQDAQLENSLVARDYIETTTVPVYGGLTDNMPRLDYTDATCPSLLLEPQRRNLVRNSEYIGGSGWVPQGLTFEYNAAISPEGFQNATLLKTTTSYSRHNIRESNNVAADSAFSVFAKAKELRYIQIASAGNIEQYANFDLLASNIEDVVVQSGSLFSNVKAEDYGNGWYRLSAVCDNSNNHFYISLLETGTQGWLWTWSGANNTDGLYVYGAQHEDNGSGGAASYPTSYIPTYGSTQTRAADDMDLNPSTAWDSTGNWTLVWDVTRINDNSTNEFSVISLGGPNGRVRLDFTSPNKTGVLIREVGGQYNVVNINNLTAQGEQVKVAVKNNGTTMQVFINGTEYTPTNPTYLAGSFSHYIGNSRHIKQKEVYFPTALTDAECISLTTL